MATVLASWTRGALVHAVALGMSRRALLDAAGLHEHALEDPEGRIPYVRHLALWQAIENHANRRPIGLHMARRAARVEALDIVGYLFRASTHIRALSAVLERYGRLLNENSRQRIAEGPLGCIIEDGPLYGPQWPAAYAEYTAAFYCLLLQRWTRNRLTPSRITFRHPAPSSIEPYHALFDCPVDFAQPRLALTYPRRLLEEPLLGADSTLHRHLARQADILLAQLPPASFHAQVVRAIDASLIDGPTLARVARQLGLGARTLQRRLQDEGLAFRRLLDERRRHAADTGLRDLSLGIEDCAERCGFTQSSAFRRAFRRWTGRSPSAFRQALKQTARR
jgi:AraC-like DNA-binding protein